MANSAPPKVVVDALLAPVTRHTRRVEIYEQDGVTRWSGDDRVRLKGGKVEVDYGRSERRSLDLTLSNTDGGLITGPGKFWYDKVIKVFRGVIVNEHKSQPSVIVLGNKAYVGSPTGFAFHGFRRALTDAGFTDVKLGINVTTYYEVKDYDIIVGLGSSDVNERAVLVEAYGRGKSVMLQDADAEAWIPTVFPGATSSPYTETTVSRISGSTHSASRGWSSFDIGVALNSWATADDEYTPIAIPSSTPGESVVSAFEDDSTDGRAVALSAELDYSNFSDAGYKAFLKSAFDWLDKYEPITTWETQIGEFMIDRISDKSFPHEVVVTGRDYTKKCLKSKFEGATQFPTGLSLESIIGAIATTAGVLKKNLPATGIVVNKKFFFERGVERWKAMEEIARSYNYELYFDAFGYLTIREFKDPTTSSPSIYIHPGKDGQLASWEKSTSDARLYNHVLVTGESSDAAVVPVSAEAKNETPGSFTSIAEIGDRLYQYTSSFITTTQQAQDVADKFLAIHSLEEFEISFDTLMLPWLEAGDIMGFDDGVVDNGDDPTSFLLSTISIPLSLGPMSGLGKRVTIVS